MPLIIVEEKLKQLPEEYLTDVANYIDSLIEAVSKKKLNPGKGMASAFTNLSLIDKEKQAMEKGMVEHYERTLVD